MRVKLSTSDVGLSNKDIFTSRVELLDAYNEVIEQGINLNYASTLVDNMLVGLDIVQKYNNSKNATAALESLQKIVSKSPVEITASCEGVGEALKAAWDKFIEICKTVWQKIKNFFIRLKNWMFGTNKANLEKTKQLKDRANAAKPGKESLSAGLEGADGGAKYIGRRLPNAAYRFAEGISKIIGINISVLKLLRGGIIAKDAENAEGPIQQACSASDQLTTIYSDFTSTWGRVDPMELLGRNLHVFKVHRADLHDRFSDEFLDSRHLDGWNQSYILQALDLAEKIGVLSEGLQKHKGLAELEQLTLNEEAISKLKLLTTRIAPSSRSSNEVMNTLQNDKKMLFIAKCCANAIRVVSSESAFCIAELPKIHAFINREIEKVLNALGY